MNTAKPISVISYNTEPFLRSKLTELQKAHKIDFWAYVFHLAEDDECRKKDHFHVYIELSKRTQTALLQEEFREFDPTHPDTALKAVGLTLSKFGDWYMYALHDADYLASKGETRVHHYTPEDIISPDDDELYARVYRIDLSDLSPIKRLRAFYQSGKTFNQAVVDGIVPIPQITQYQRAWIALANVGTDRNGKPGHDIVDPDTGELI